MSHFIERPRTTCSLGGALAAISSLPGVVPISHTASGCAGNLSGATANNSGYCGSSYCSGQSVPVSNISQKQVIFGGGERLEEEIRSAQELIDAELFVVTTGCMTEIIADDMSGVIAEFRDSKPPVIYINTPSFEADAYGGYEILLHALLNQFIPAAKYKKSNLVNLFGVVPLLDPFFRGDLEELKRLLQRLGLQVNTFFSADQTFYNLTSAAEAGLNIVLSPIRGRKVAEAFREKHQTPYFVTELPVGAAATEEFLYQIADQLQLERSLVETVIQSENEIYYRYLERAADLIADAEFKFYVEVVSNANTALSYARFLERELGWLPHDIVITDILTDAQKLTLQERFAVLGLRGTLIFETDTWKIEQAIMKHHPENHGEFYFNGDGPLYVLGSSLEKEFAEKRGAGFLGISYPLYHRTVLDRGYAGYRGGLHLVEDILSSLVAGK